MLLAAQAYKAFYRELNYRNERNCYRRLQECSIQEVAGFEIPRLLDFDDDLMIVEMGFVTPPRILDFGKAYLDNPPDYAAGTMEDSIDAHRELYSDQDWDLVEQAVAELRAFAGIYYYDLRPGNIQVRAES